MHWRDKQKPFYDNMASIRSELLFLETVLGHVRNKSLHLIDFEEFSGYQGYEIKQIYDSVNKLYEFSRKHVIHKMSKPVSSIKDLLNEESDRKSKRTLKMMLEDKVFPWLYSDIRLKALKDIEKRNKNRFKIEKTSPKEFTFNLLLREKMKKQKEVQLSLLNKNKGKKSVDDRQDITSKYNSHEGSLMSDHFDVYHPEFLPTIK